MSYQDTIKRKSRKEHRCDECGTTIKAGESYHETRGVYDGRWWGHTACEGCGVVCGMAYEDLGHDFEFDGSYGLSDWMWEQGYEAIVANEHLLAFALRCNEAAARYAKGKPYDLEGNRQGRDAWRQLAERQTKLIDALMAKHGESK